MGLSVWSLLICGVAFSVAEAQSVTIAVDRAEGYTLHDALRKLRESHPALVAARAAVSASAADRTLAKLWTNPNVFGTYLRGVSHSSYDPSGYTSYGVSQFLELSNAPSARKHAAAKLYDAARADYDALLLALSFDVEGALIEVVSIEQKLSLTQRAAELIGHAARIVEQRVQAGAAPRYDATRIAVTEANAEADCASLSADLARAQGELNAAIGPGSEALHGRPSYSLASEAPLPAPSSLLAFFMRHRPDLEAARRRAASADANISVAKRSVWPGLSLNVQAGYGAAPRQQDVGVGVSLPLPVVNRGQGLISGARARAAGAGAQVELLKMTAERRIDGLYREVAARRRAHADYAARAVASGDEMLQEAQAAYLAGRFSVLELADAYLAWRGARLRAIELLTAARTAEIDLGREVGGALRDVH